MMLRSWIGVGLILCSLNGAYAETSVESAFTWKAIGAGKQELFRDGRKLGSWDRASGIFTTPAHEQFGYQGGALYYDPVADTVLLTPGDNALAEVNEARARRGLRPYRYDHGLTLAAARAASWRARALCTGHTANDFAYLPAGAHAAAAGCAAWEPSWGWGSCCAYDNYTYAGAAWALGADGRRYMHLFVR